MNNQKSGLVRICGKVMGSVQGVGYRAFARRQAQLLGLKGWVRNLGDGSVAFEAEGNESGISDFITQLGQGPRFSHVDEILLENKTAISEYGYTSFEIR